MNELELNRVEFKSKMKKRRMITYSLALIILIAIAIAIVYGRSNQKINFLGNLGIGRYEIQPLRDTRKEYEKALNIQNIDYSWGDGVELGNEPEYLIIHHAASNNLTPEQIHEMHLSKDWAGIGYHFYIRQDGTIYRGRREDMIGAHAKGRNNTSLGICLEGNFENEQVSYAQEQALIKLCADLIIKYNIIEVETHKDVYNTLCPGANFHKEEVIEEIANELKSMYK